jgi:DNA repair exonuclease SbcCD ATPase subunit
MAVGQVNSHSALIEAVRAFDAELERFSRAAGAACRRPLDSKRDLERAAAAVSDAADAEARLQECAQELARALQAAQADQQARAESLRTRAEEIRERLETYGKLATRYQQLGAEGAALAEAAQKINALSRPSERPSSRAELVVGLADLEQRVSELRATARALGADARASRFEDLAAESHAVEQTLSALRNKLLLAQQAAAANPSTGDA